MSKAHEWMVEGPQPTRWGGDLVLGEYRLALDYYRHGRWRVRLAVFPGGVILRLSPSRIKALEVVDSTTGGGQWLKGPDLSLFPEKVTAEVLLAALRGAAFNCAADPEPKGAAGA